MQVQNIIQVGNSLAVTIPADFAKKKNYRAGQKVAVETDMVSDTLLIRPASRAVKSSLTPEFYAWLNAISKKYEKTIKELAHR